MNQDRVTQECFGAVIALTQHDGTSQGAHAIYNGITAWADRLLHQPETLGLSESEGRDFAYAVIALADELALKASPALAEFWLPRMLQTHYFNETVAGEVFFERLQALRHSSSHKMALQAYYLALALGFEGRYGVDGNTEELDVLTVALRDSYAHAFPHLSTRLSPSLVPQAEIPPPPAVRMPMWKVPLAATVIACVLFFSMQHFLEVRTAEAVSRLATRPIEVP